jgi:hypothetical protein
VGSTTPQHTCRYSSHDHTALTASRGASQDMAAMSLQALFPPGLLSHRLPSHQISMADMHAPPCTSGPLRLGCHLDQGLGCRTRL